LPSASSLRRGFVVEQSRQPLLVLEVHTRAQAAAAEDRQVKLRRASSAGWREQQSERVVHDVPEAPVAAGGFHLGPTEQPDVHQHLAVASATHDASGRP
jgi:hypothetical protein